MKAGCILLSSFSSHNRRLSAGYVEEASGKNFYRLPQTPLELSEKVLRRYLYESFASLALRAASRLVAAMCATPYLSIATAITHFLFRCPAVTAEWDA